MNVIDSSGWLEYLAQGPNAAFFADALEATDTIVVPTVCIYEVGKRILLQRSEDEALRVMAHMQQGRVVDLTAAIAIEAVRVGSANGLPLADSIILATARAFDATLWTQDSHFAAIDGVRYIARKPS